MTYFDDVAGVDVTLAEEDVPVAASHALVTRTFGPATSADVLRCRVTAVSLAFCTNAAHWGQWTGNASDDCVLVRGLGGDP